MDSAHGGHSSFRQLTQDKDIVPRDAIPQHQSLIYPVRWILDADVAAVEDLYVVSSFTLYVSRFTFPRAQDFLWYQQFLFMDLEVLRHKGKPSNSVRVANPH